MVTTAGLIEPSGGSLAQQLRVVRLLSNGIESAERKMKSSESRERKRRRALSRIEQTRRERGREIVLRSLKLH